MAPCTHDAIVRRWMCDVLGSPIWQGISAILALFNLVVVIALTCVVFRIEREEARQQRESAVSNISVHVHSSHSRQTYPVIEDWWSARVTLHNAGPASAEFVRLEVDVLANSRPLGNSGALSEVIIVRPPGRRVTLRGAMIVTDLSRPPVCRYTFEVEKWQPGEHISLEFFYRLEDLDPQVASQVAELTRRFSDFDNELPMDDAWRKILIDLEVSPLLVPKVFVYESSSLRVIQGWDATRFPREVARNWLTGREGGGTREFTSHASCRETLY